jgi:GT2 family glycosyltransferase
MSSAQHITRFAGRDEAVDVAVLIVTYNSAAEVPALIASLRGEAAHHSQRVIVADNASTDATADILAAHDDVIVVGTGGNLGYAAGINAAMAQAGSCRALLVLNPDLQVRPGAIAALLAAADAHPSAGVVAPRIIDDSGATTFSQSNEPSVTRALADAVLGPVWAARPRALSEYVRRADAYTSARTVDWVTGAALLIPSHVARAIGEWDERFFLYSEETDYCRRVRDAGLEVRYEPAAVVQHSQGKSGSSPQLDALLSVNRVRYMRKHAPRRAGAYRLAVALGAALRARRSVSARESLAFLRSESRWSELPSPSPAA